MSFNHPSIESCDKSEEKVTRNREYSPPSFSDGAYNDIAEGLYVPDNYGKAEFVETSNVYDDIDQDQVLSTNCDNIYDSGFKDRNSDEWKQEEGNTRKEKELWDREELITNSKQALRLNNWPWFYPITYHDIEAEIPKEFKVHTRRQYWLCLATWCALVWNWVVILAGLLGGLTTGIMTFIWASMYLGLGVVGAWKTWYKSLYISLKGGGTTLRWLLFMTSYIAHTTFVCLAVVGLPTFGMSGLFFMINMFAKSNAVGIMALIGFGLWSLVAVFSVLLLKKSWNLFRSSNDIKDTKKEFIRAMANPAAVS